MRRRCFTSLFLLCAVLAQAHAAGQPQSGLPPALRGTWLLSVESPEHHTVATLTVRFTGEAAKSCRGGDWRRVSVLSVKTTDLHFFPTRDALSYRVEDSQLTVGRNGVCDAYLALRGPLQPDVVRGDYVAWGKGGERPLGHFSLRRRR